MSLISQRLQQRTPRRRNPDVPGLTPAAAQRAIAAAFQVRRIPLWLPLGITLIWTLALLVATLMPSTYTTRWSLILPTSNASSTVALESIGQTTMQPGQPFSNVTLSPKVIYREILGSERLADDAASRLGLTRIAFGNVRIRSVDETSLLNLEISGRTADEALNKARALNDAFAAKLDQLRNDEADRRANSVRGSLKAYDQTLALARDRVQAFQKETGFLSVSQFADATQAAEIARRKSTELSVDIEKIAQERQSLMQRLGLSPTEASAMLKLLADGSFQVLARAYSEANATHQEGLGRFGHRHPTVAIALAKRDGIAREIAIHAKAKGFAAPLDGRIFELSTVASQQAELLRTLVATDVQLEGRRAEIAALKTDLQRLERDASRMSSDALRLEALKKDQLVAEAVYTSAAARLDTSRSDIYASYPLVQVLAAPEAPHAPRRIHWIFAIAAACVGTLLLIIAWGFQWARARFVRKTSKSRLFT